MADKQDVWGIDIGQAGLKAVHLRYADAADQVLAMGHQYIPHPKILSQPDAIPEELIPQAMLPAGLQHLVDQEVGKVDDDLTKMIADDSYMEIVMSAKGLSAIGDSNLSLKETLNSLEKEMIRRVLDEVDGNVSMCARVLKVQRTTLIERIKKYSLS